jgi:hypothetical protein
MGAILVALAECEALVFAYTRTRHSAAPFAFFAYFLPLIALMPWLSYMGLMKTLRPVYSTLDTKMRCIVSTKLSMALVAAYGLFTFALMLPNLLNQ